MKGSIKKIFYASLERDLDTLYAALLSAGMPIVKGEEVMHRPFARQNIIHRIQEIYSNFKN